MHGATHMEPDTPSGKLPLSVGFPEYYSTRRTVSNINGIHSIFYDRINSICIELLSVIEKADPIYRFDRHEIIKTAGTALSENEALKRPEMEKLDFAFIFKQGKVLQTRRRPYN